MTDSDKPNRIPASESQAYNAWSLPEMESGEAVAAGFHRRGAESTAAQTNEPATQQSGWMTAEQLEEIAQAAYQDAYQEGRDQGYSEGFEQGRQDGLAQGQATIDERAGQLQQVLGQLMAPLEHQQEAIEEALLSLVTSLARQVIRRELDSRPEDIRAVIGDCVASLPLGQDNLRISLAPADHEALQSLEQGLDPHWQLRADSRMEPGDCRVTTDQSLVEYTVDQRFQSALQTMLDKRMETATAAQDTAGVDASATADTQDAPGEEATH